MENYCAFSKNHACLKWLDYVITRQELEEADSLCHGKLDRNSTQEPIHSDPTGDSGQQSHLIPR